MDAPPRLIHQKATGTTDLFFFSLTSHWISMRPVNRSWPTRPNATQKIPSGVVMLRTLRVHRVQSEGAVRLW